MLRENLQLVLQRVCYTNWDSDQVCVLPEECSHYLNLTVIIYELVNLARELSLQVGIYHLESEVCGSHSVTSGF